MNFLSWLTNLASVATSPEIKLISLYFRVSQHLILMNYTKVHELSFHYSRSRPLLKCMERSVETCDLLLSFLAVQQQIAGKYKIQSAYYKLVYELALHELANSPCCISPFVWPVMYLFSAVTAGFHDLLF